ncbi:unnamed protein product [Peronospora farinosa]|uniref:Uncharacterized protein n=1 Tax=Peronospora farinosa TaxID=134698 RepID=A0AAV0UYC2_9STRA|nr:unnamed protein product [Peronospora farinosa]
MFLLLSIAISPVFAGTSEPTLIRIIRFTYFSHRSFCYGIHRPLKVLPTVNSDGLHDEWSGASREGARDHLVPAKQLVLDPYYHEYELPD